MTDTAARPAGSDVAPADLAVTIDGRRVLARPGELVIDVAERAGVFIPRFCYHPRMEPVGMCRMCLVEISGPRGFSLQPSCYIRVSDGLEVLTRSDKARKAQEGVIEFLLVNHPLDCPVCDKGGECPLQDQSLSHGPGETRFIEEKRHFEKPIEIGPLVLLDRERCIQCARCTRFALEVAGEAQIDFAGRGDQIEVAPFPELPFSSYFSGNTVQICPVGALTSTPYRFKSRPWDLEQVETTCTTCSFGCRVAAQSSAGRLVRYLGIDADPVNQSWLCDKGRYGFEAVNAADRLGSPLLRRSGELVPARWAEALREVVAGVRQSHATAPEGAIGMIGGARLTNEDAYAWSLLARSVLRTNSVDAQLGDGLPAEAVLGLPRATIDQATTARAVLLLCGDLREEVPVLYLRLRDAVRRGGLQLVECASVPSALSGIATARLAYRPGEAATLVQALLGSGPAPTGAEVWGVGSLDAARRALGLAEGAGATAGEGVVVVLGRPSLAESEESVAAAAAALARALPAARFLPALRRANVLGALDMGLAPGVLPGRVALDAGRDALGPRWGELPAAAGRDTTAMLRAAAAGELAMLVLLAADPIADHPDAALARAALEAVPFVVALGTHPDASNELADVVLPIAGPDERVGTTTNIEGRVSLLAQKVVPPGNAWPAWMVATELASRLGTELGFTNTEDIWADIVTVAPSHRGASMAVIASLDHRDGVVLPLPPTAVSIGTRRPGGAPAGAAGAAPATEAAPAPEEASGPELAGAPDVVAAIGQLRPIDPIATPGIESVEEQGAPQRVGAAMPLAGEHHLVGPPPLVAPPSTPPSASPLSWPAGEDVAVPEVPAPASGSLRLVVRRRLYDRGTLVQASPSLAPLAPPAELAVAPAALERAGGREGGLGRLLPLGSPGPAADERADGDGSRAAPRGPDGLEVVLVADDGVPEGVGVLWANLADASGRSATTLLRAGAAVLDVTLEVLA